MLGLQRLGSGIVSQIYRRTFLNSTSNRAAQETRTSILNPIKEHDIELQEVSRKGRNSMVAAAFEALKDSQTSDKDVISTNSVDVKITSAKTVNSLLAIVETNSPIARRHALKIISVLAEWSSKNRVKISEFENDSRFLQICRLLGKTAPKGVLNNSINPSSSKNQISGFRTDDLNTVLGVAGDDEAAKLIASISVPQMIKVLSALAQQKRRSTPLLRSLAFNISSANEQLDLKKCADVLYAMATLNFQDSVLAAKICADVQSELNKNIEKSAVCGSILTSLGILKYRDLDIMESLTDWVLKNNEICRPQDINAFFLTSALLNFRSSKINELVNGFKKTVGKNDFPKKNDWLNYVWAMVMLQIVDDSHLASVLSNEFIKELESEKNGLLPTAKMKLLNINSYAELIAKSYSGPRIASDSIIFDFPMTHTKSKQILINGLLDAMKALLPSDNHFKSLVDSRMGFIIDGICMFDSKRNPISLNKETCDGIKVALMVIEYHDVCHGAHRSANGITNLSFNLLEKRGYNVIPVPYNEFNTGDKLLKRVQYLEKKFKEIVKLDQKL